VTEARDITVDELNDRLDEMIEQARADSQGWAELAEDAYDYTFGNQLKRVPVRDGWERIQLNYLFPAMAQQGAMMAQRKPLLVAAPEQPDDAEAARFWQGLLRWQFDSELGMPSIARAAVLDAWLWGHYVAKVYWEERAEWLDEEKRWRGAPRVVLLEPDKFGVDPDAEKADIASAGFILCQRRMLLAKAVQRWPARKEEIEEAAADVEEPDNDPVAAAFMRTRIESRTEQSDDGIQETLVRESRLVELLRRARGYETPASAAADERTGLPRWVTVTECYFHDGALKSGQIDEPVPREDLLASGQAAVAADGTLVVADPAAFGGGLEPGAPLDPARWPKRIVRRWDDEPEFPYGRHVLRIGKRLILNPAEADQRWAFRRWPYVVGVAQALPHTWRGLNGVEMAIGLQDAVNADGAHLATWIKQHSDPVTLVEEGVIAGDPENRKISARLKARAGAIWKLVKGGLGRIQRVPPPPMAQGLLAAYQLLTRELQDQTGSQEVARGRQAGGQPTAAEILELARNARVRTSSAAGAQDDFLASAMQLVAWMDQAYLEPGQLVRIVGESGNPSMARIPAESVRFDVRLQIGTALPYDQERRRQLIGEVFKALGPDALALLPEFLAAYEMENAEDLLKRVSVWQRFREFEKAEADIEQVAARAAAGQKPAGGSPATLEPAAMPAGG